ncbi:hypothetical protein PPERSA_11223 [Pseudocohnilembus persalinus]|uniref:Uncharacterized protein n=1 Tax=Pseudocohnilembus persalinus TaxID=266149 RepID=A0A0V0R044_PSEPJ|nr:hypothetical protein PPERSA_11223 [Pseudocohnilembus persalinus]|eukprot:KRX07674.1 hypothetical protein PPERSA_11223 [Pseudocohnilembus persalinus]
MQAWKDGFILFIHFILDQQDDLLGGYYKADQNSNKTEKNKTSDIEIDMDSYNQSEENGEKSQQQDDEQLTENNELDLDQSNYLKKINYYQYKIYQKQNQINNI